ncbi:MAG: NADH-quinone oxidoreductase subunit NuoI [Campylobacteraceae bacterium]|nr:NADH-quinone oxidoreductase subunit NuoI [Campylobacteraceae bacterium]
MSYVELDKRKKVVTNRDKFERFLRRTFRLELFKGLFVTFREMVKKDNCHTLLYPQEKLELNNRYRGVHKLLRVLESGNERCIGCGLCAQICISNCIDMETSIDEKGRKEVGNYSINLGRCVYCGMCADVCPELAIVHGGDYEFASEQRAYFGFKEDLLEKSRSNSDAEFEGYGSLPKNADELIKFTPTAYIKDDKEEL